MTEREKDKLRLKKIKMKTQKKIAEVKDKKASAKTYMIAFLVMVKKQRLLVVIAMKQLINQMKMLMVQLITQMVQLKMQMKT